MLEGIARLDLPDGPGPGPVVIVDNDAEGSSRPVVEATPAHALVLEYVASPARDPWA